jgi:ankyrin repeat protein
MEAGDVRMASRLVARGMDINARNSEGRVPLWYAKRPRAQHVAERALQDLGACQYGSVLNDVLFAKQYARAHELLDAGADPTVQYHANGSTAMHFAAQSGDIGVVRRLVLMGMDINALNDRKQVPMSFAKRAMKQQLHNLGAYNAVELRRAADRRLDLLAWIDRPTRTRWLCWTYDVSAIFGRQLLMIVVDYWNGF